MSAEFDEFNSSGLTDALDVIGDTFKWNGQNYACAIDHVRHSLTTSKSLFQLSGASRSYPQRGDAIIVAGRKVQVTKLANSALKAAAGGVVEDQPFIDDPHDPGLDIEFDKFIKR